MNKEQLWNRPMVDEIAEGDRILVTQDGTSRWSTPDQIKTYMGTTEDPAVLGIPVPTAADAGKVLTVKKTGDGFFLKPLEDSVLLWENPNPKADFPAQTIAFDGSNYGMFTIYVTHTGQTDGVNTRHRLVFVPKNAGTIRMTVPMISSTDKQALSWREANAADNGITFSNGYRFYNNFVPGENSRHCVPLKIYGMK